MRAASARKYGSMFAAGVAVLITTSGAAQEPRPEDLRFSVAEGQVFNEFYRQGPVAAHLVLTPGNKPRVVLAFPAGNSGLALWFAAQSSDFSWQSPVAIRPAQRTLAGGRVLRGTRSCRRA